MKTFLSLLFTCLVSFVVGQNIQILRTPAINNNGTLVSFSYQGDIWTVPSTGGKATRLTIHEAYEGSPVFSPDGSQIAFSGSRYGNNDIYTIPTIGGQANRLTYHSGNDQVASWTQSDKILFSTNREFREIERPSEVYSINPNGGTESRFLDAVGVEPVISPDGRFLAFVRGDINPVARKAYEGSSNREIWIYDTKNKTYQKLPLTTFNDISPQWGTNNTLYFLSSQGGTYNLYRLKIDANGKMIGKIEPLTKYDDESIRSFSLSKDANTIVFEKDLHLYILKTDKLNVQKLQVDIKADDRFDPTEMKSFSREMNEYSISPNNKLIALSVRGEIFVKENDKESSRTINVSQHAYRDMDPVWLNDSILLFTSDRNNANFDVFMIKSSDTSETDLFKSMKHSIVQVTNSATDENNLSVSPDGKKLAYLRGRGTLVVTDISSDGKLTKEVILHDGWAPCNGLKWSPDSKWVAYSQNDLYFNEEVFIQAVENTSKPVNVSMHPRTDRRPYWSADGSKLGFVSERSAGKSEDIWFVWLKKEDWEKSDADWNDKEEEEDENNKPRTSKDKKNIPAIKIDFENIHERVVQVTSFPGNESDFLISKDGKTFYYTTSSNAARGRDLYSIKWDGKSVKELTKGGSNPSNLYMDKEGKSLYYNKQGSLTRMDIKGSGNAENLPYTAKMKIDYVSERSQVFEEAWRTIRDGFHDPKFHGYDWNKLRVKYRDRCIYASTEDDFADMFNLMLGELNASHMGLRVPDRVETQRDATGLLGAELMPVPQGMKVSHVVTESPADKIASKLMEDDVITAVNGQMISNNTNFYQLLNGLANEKVLLNVTGKDGKSREVTVRLTSSISNNLYKQWVDNRKKLVEKYSNGRLGYIHIKGMDFPSFEVVEREFTAAGYGKDGLVIDVRYNGGGSTTDFLMSILNYKQHAYTVPRGASENPEKDKEKFRDYYPTGERLVYAAWMKPSIALCNEGSYSNAEIFSHAYQSLGIGTLVGLPTNGSVISTGGRGLMDGSFIRLPGRMWFTKSTNKNQELGPAVPDIIVENQPDWISKGTDDQLKTAVDVLIKQLNSKK